MIKYPILDYIMVGELKDAKLVLVPTDEKYIHYIFNTQSKFETQYKIGKFTFTNVQVYRLGRTADIKKPDLNSFIFVDPDHPFWVPANFDYEENTADGKFIGTKEYATYSNLLSPDEVFRYYVARIGNPEFAVLLKYNKYNPKNKSLIFK